MTLVSLTLCNNAYPFNRHDSGYNAILASVSNALLSRTELPLLPQCLPPEQLGVLPVTKGGL